MDIVDLPELSELTDFHDLLFKRLEPSGPFELIKIIELQTNLTFQKIIANRGSNKISGSFILGELDN